MYSEPKIRFVVPTLGRNLPWLRRTLESIRSQEIDVDLVLVAPKTAPVRELAQELGARVLEERGCSLSEALNQGFEIEHENVEFRSIEYFAWLGDDDLLAPGSLRCTVSALDARPRASLVIGRIRYIAADGTTKWVLRSGAWAAWYARLGQNFMGQPGSLMRRRCFETVGGLDPELKNSMDQDLFLKLAGSGSVRYLPVELASFRVHESSISSTKGGYDERSFVSEKFRPLMPRWVDGPVRVLTKVSDRILLSMHSRIPHPAAPLANGRPYHEG
jgi:GT2 family glycosyltransferase